MNIANPLSCMFEQDSEVESRDVAKCEENCLAFMHFPEFFHSLPNAKTGNEIE